MAAHLVDAGLEGDPGARRRLFEDQRDGPTGQGARGAGIGLELERAVEQAREPRARELGAGEEVAGQGEESMVACENRGMRPTPVLLLLLVPLLIAACGGGGGGNSGGGGGSQTASACPKSAVVIHMHNIKFSPDTATAKAGQKVCWVNDDDVQHDAVADNGEFKSKLFGNGQTFTTTVSKPGSISYVCTVHPGMTGTLKVKS
jgi:plastocyanin